MTGYRRAMRLPLGMACAVLVVLMIGCGDDDSDETSETTEQAGSTEANDEPGSGAGADPGSFPNEPQLSADLSTCPEEWTGATCSGGAYTLEATGGIASLAAPTAIEPGNRGALVELRVFSIEGEGSFGIACRTTFEEPFTGYALIGNYQDGWAIWRYTDGVREQVQHEVNQPIVPDQERLILRLVCGIGTDEAAGHSVGLAYSVNEQPLSPLAPVHDQTGLAFDGPTAQAGLIAEGGNVVANLSEFTLRIAG